MDTQRPNWGIVRIPVETYLRLKTDAEQQDVAMAEIVRRALTAWWARRGAGGDRGPSRPRRARGVQKAT